MRTITNIALSLTIIILFGCGSSQDGDYEMGASESKSQANNGNINGYISSTAAAVSKDTTRKFIRTADLRYRVKDALKATLALENITADFDGFVTYTHLTSNI